MSDPIEQLLDDKQRCSRLYANTLKLLDNDIVACIGDEYHNVNQLEALMIQVIRNQQKFGK